VGKRARESCRKERKIIAEKGRKGEPQNRKNYKKREREKESKYKKREKERES
jgi:hypothetical protein